MTSLEQPRSRLYEFWDRRDKPGTRNLLAQVVDALAQDAARRDAATLLAFWSDNIGDPEFDNLIVAACDAKVNAIQAQTLALEQEIQKAATQLTKRKAWIEKLKLAALVQKMQDDPALQVTEQIEQTRAALDSARAAQAAHERALRDRVERLEQTLWQTSTPS